MPPSNEDTLPGIEDYKFICTAENSDEFLAKYKPSMVQDDGTKPWIWALGPNDPSQRTGVEAMAQAVDEATNLLKEVSVKVEAIKADTSIPTRSNKKTGAKSKKEVREEVQAKATASLKEIALKHGYTTGKWLLFASADNVDSVWTKLAKSMTSGPLSTSAASKAKVSTSPAVESLNYQHVICVYLANAWDEAAVTEVQRILLRNHGLKLTGVKADLYTVIGKWSVPSHFKQLTHPSGLDSKHSSGIPSTIWKAAGSLKEEEAKKLKDAYWEEVNGTGPSPADASKLEGDSAADAPKPKKIIPAKAKSTAVGDDPFASDDDEVPADKVEAKPVKATKTGTAAKSSKASKRAATDSEEEEKPKKKSKTSAVAKSKKKKDSDSD